MRQDASRGGSPTSINSSPEGFTSSPVRMRMRTVRGDTNWMEKGSVGLTGYSTSGKVRSPNGRSTAISVLKAMRG
jgi:hypothetical protein